MIGFIVGLFVGAFLGVVVMCCCFVASKADDEKLNNLRKYFKN